MSTEAPTAPTLPNPVLPDAPPLPAKGGFLAGVKKNIVKHDAANKHAAATAAPAEPAAPAQPAATTPPTPPEPPKATTPDAPAAPEPGDDIPENFSSAKAENWKKLREIRSNLETKIKTYEQQLKAKEDEVVALRTKPEVPKEFQEKHESILKERDTYAAIVERQAMEQDPRFQATYDKPLEAKLESAKKIVGDKGEQLASILAAPDGKWRNAALKELLSDMDAFDAGRLGTIVQQYDELRADRTNKLADSREQMKIARELDAQKRAEQQKAEQAKREERINATLKSAEKFETFKDDKAQASLRKLLSGETDWNTFADTAIRGMDYARLEKTIEALNKELKEAKDAVTAMTGTSPGVRTGAGQQPGPATAKTPYGNSEFMGGVLKTLQRGPGGRGG